MAFIAGAYTVGFGAQANIGYTEVGFEKVIRPAFNVIRADATGRTPIDGIATGIEDCVVRMELIEWSATLFDALAPYISGDSGVRGSVLVAGQLMSTLCKSLVLTPVTGNAVASGLTWTYARAYPLEPLRTIFSAQRLRTSTLGFYIFGGAVPVTYKVPMFTAA
jgi:hypothetical protein